MKKIISSLLTTFLLFSFVLAQEIEAEVDVVVDSPQVQLQSMLQIVEKRVFKLQISNEEKQKLMNKIKETFQNTDVPKTLLCVELCNAITKDWTKQKNYEYCIQNMEQIQNRIRAQIRLATKEIEQLQEQNQVKKQKAIEVLQSLLEAGIPVEHALAVVKEAIKTKEADVKSVATSKALRKLEKHQISLPAELKDQIRAEIKTQMQVQQQTQPEVYQKMKQEYQEYKDSGQPKEYRKGR